MTYSSLSAHASMVFDQTRNGLYAKAIRDKISPDSVVLDLGAGLGIHGLLAAAAGARRVYLVEPEPVIRIAMEIAQANGLQDRVVGMQGRIQSVTLPEQVDMIVSVFTGNLLFSEDLLPSLFHARDRYLKAGGALVPDRAELMLAPVHAIDLHAQRVARWSDPLHGLDYSVARRFASNEILWRHRDDIRPERMAEGSAVAVVDMMTAAHADCNGEIRSEVSIGGVCHGLLGWIRIRLGDEWLTADPLGPKVHWGAAYLPFDQPIVLRTGEVITLGLNRPKGGDWTWWIKAESGGRRQSTFLAKPDAADRMRRLSPGNRPVLDPEGRAVRQLLQWMDGSVTAHELAQRLHAWEPDTYHTLADATELVQTVVRRYAV